jgi:hypothetical protein
MEENKDIEYAQEILALVQAGTNSNQVAILHRLGHEKLDNYTKLPIRQTNRPLNVSHFWGPDTTIGLRSIQASVLRKMRN